MSTPFGWKDTPTGPQPDYVLQAHIAAQQWDRLSQAEQAARIDAWHRQREADDRNRADRQRREHEAQARIESTRAELVEIVRQTAEDHPSWMQPVKRAVMQRGRPLQGSRWALVEVERAWPLGTTKVGQTKDGDDAIAAVGLTAQGRVVGFCDYQGWVGAAMPPPPVRTRGGWKLADTDTAGDRIWDDGQQLLAALGGLRERLNESFRSENPDADEPSVVTPAPTPRGITGRQAARLAVLRGELYRHKQVWGETMDAPGRHFPRGGRITFEKEKRRRARLEAELRHLQSLTGQ